MKNLYLLTVFFALVTFASGAMAIPKPAPEPAPEAAGSTAPGKPMMGKIEKFSGVIEKVSEKGNTIVVKGKVMKEEKLLTFVIDNKTKISKGKARMTPSDLKKEMQVSVEYKNEMGGMTAVTIEISIP